MRKDLVILQAGMMPDWTQRRLDETFSVIRLPDDPAQAERFLAERGGEVRGVAWRRVRLGANLLTLMPRLEIISCYPAGLDGIDVAAARGRGIEIRNTSEIQADDVADLAVGLAIATLRGLVRADAFVRAGKWGSGQLPTGRAFYGLRTGIVGLGHIGLAIGRRLEAMRAEIGYFGPRPKPVDYRYFDDIEKMAGWAELLVVACPATPQTKGLIGTRVLEALGRHGYLVNISRGSIVDEPALVAALAGDRLAGAGLDVFAHEPHVPPALVADPRVVLSPHAGGNATREVQIRMGTGLVQALLDHFGKMH